MYWTSNVKVLDFYPSNEIILLSNTTYDERLNEYCVLYWECIHNFLMDILNPLAITNYNTIHNLFSYVYRKVVIYFYLI